MSCFGSNLFFKKKGTTNNYERLRQAFVQQSFLKLCKKFQGKRASGSDNSARGTLESMFFTYSASSSPLKFS